MKNLLSIEEKQKKYIYRQLPLHRITPDQPINFR